MGSGIELIIMGANARLPINSATSSKMSSRSEGCEMRKSRMIFAPVCSPGYIYMVQGVRGEGVSFSSRSQAKNMIIQSAREKEAISWS
jgi:hypothetical protein